MDEFWDDLLDETAFSLYAIHTNLEDHALAYALNQNCGLRLQRTRKNLELAGHGAFVVFHWKDEACYREWTLFRNPGMDTPATPSEGLFRDEPAVNRPYLVPERKEVDFFLKLEGEPQGLQVLSGLMSIPRVMTAYQLETSGLKSRHNLIY